jgi:hypothetical protein
VVVVAEVAVVVVEVAEFLVPWLVVKPATTVVLVAVTEVVVLVMVVAVGTGQFTYSRNPYDHAPTSSSEAGIGSPEFISNET